MESWTVPSESVPGKTYTVTRDDRGRFSCTCPDYRFRRRECKHIKLVKKLLLAKRLERLKDSTIMRNPMIRWNNIEPREYQVRIAEAALDKNTLVVLPTALGKTMIAIYLTAHYLYNYPDKKVLVMAPTKPLTHQHRDSFLKFLRIKPDEVKVLTGEVKPEYRLYWWDSDSIKLYFATPQVVRNDLDLGLNLRNFSLLVFDEAHRARKNYAYTLVAEAYLRQSPCPVILGLTASPGADEKKVREIAEKLSIEHVEYRSEFDEDVRPYVHEIETSYRVVDPPKSYGEYVKVLREMLNEQLAKLMRAGLIKKDPEYVFRKDLLELGDMLRFEVETTMLDEERGRMWDLVMAQSIALILYHAIDLLLSQGQYAFKSFLEKVVKERRKQSHRRLARDPRFRELLERIKHEELEEHPKIPKLLEVIEDQLDTDPGGRILVFTQYRSSAKHIADVLKSNGYRAEIFVGHGRRGRRRGDKAPTMTQKQQLETLQRFRDGDLQILVATSIGEEGLDIPQCDLVVFYEPVPSEVRLIQRRGRTGRARAGRCVILATDKTLDMAYLVGAAKRAKRMRKVMEKISSSLRPVKRRIFPEPKPLGEEYLKEADRAYEEYLKGLKPVERPKPVERVELKVLEKPVYDRVPGAPEELKPIELLEADEERAIYRSFRREVSSALKHIRKMVFRAGARGVPRHLLEEDLEAEGFSRASIIAALMKLKRAGVIHEENGVLYPSGKRRLDLMRAGLIAGDFKVYRIYVEEVYPGKAVVLVNDRWHASVPAEMCDTPIPLRKKREFKVLGRLVKVDGKLHLRIIDVLEGEL